MNLKSSHVNNISAMVIYKYTKLQQFHRTPTVETTPEHCVTLCNRSYYNLLNMETVSWIKHEWCEANMCDSQPLIAWV